MKRQPLGNPSREIRNLARSGRKPFFIPCASKSCIELLLLNHGIEIRGKKVAIIGRDKIVGLPASLLMQSASYMHKQNSEQITSEANIVVTYIGIRNIVRGDWIKKGAVVIDTGTNQVNVLEEVSFMTEIIDSTW
ncbi:methylenetetrahydrofolate dehydrogenase [Medicago truncatula]|uniref:Methylenetetrahydrofolate dehydrogenase n=1 Tax=Medicago truncatula TaxID=3880 RepID=G7IVA5_MEDTR|nr:methylenetetrahydrofolate dehydrogenase [Medicago truncatula]